MNSGTHGVNSGTHGVNSGTHGVNSGNTWWKGELKSVAVNNCKCEGIISMVP